MVTVRHVLGHAFRRARLRYRIQAAALVAGLVALVALVGAVLFGGAGLLVAGALGAMVLALTPQVPPAWIARAAGARPLAPWSAPGLVALVDALARRAGLPRRPALFLAPTPQPNAFAVGGRDDAAVVVSAGLLRALGDRELAGVLAHELSHVRQGDGRLLRLATVLGHLTSSLSRAGLLVTLLLLPAALFGWVSVPWQVLPLLLVAPLAANGLLLALSRRRELEADLGAVELTGDPAGLASALARLERRQRSLLERLLGVPADVVPPWLRTHPTTDVRIRRLRDLAAGVG